MIEILPKFISTELSCFKIVWSIPPPKSFLSGELLLSYLHSGYSFSCCAHVLSKAANKYPHFRLYLKNIILLSPTEHHLLDQGNEKQRITYAKEVKTADWSKIDRLREELLQEYKKHFPSTVGMIIGYHYSPDEVLEVIRVLNGEFMDAIKH